jgi:hypothetical protein
MCDDEAPMSQVQILLSLVERGLPQVQASARRHNTRLIPCTLTPVS